jgi:uncharacterized membrane protein
MLIMPGFRHHWMHGHPWGGGFFGGPGMLLSVMGTLVWIALLIGLAWAILSLLMPTIRPMLADIFGSKSANISALEILRQRYASGEIDGVTFEQMHERLLASYQQEGYGVPRDAGYQEEGWIRYKNT